MSIEQPTDGTNANNSAPAATATPAPDASAATPVAASPATAAPAPGATLLTPAAPATPTPDAGPKAAEAKKDGEEGDDANKPVGAPEQYEEFKAAEGVTLNTEALGEFKDLAKECNLTQEAAQKMVDLGAKLTQKVEAGIVAKIEKTQAEWADASLNDKEFGGDNLAANMAIANKAIDQFGSQGLKALLAESKLGNHPEVVRAFYRVGKAISEDKFVGGGSREGSADPTKVMYPSMHKTN